MLKRTAIIGLVLCLAVSFAGCSRRDRASESEASAPLVSSGQGSSTPEIQEELPQPDTEEYSAAFYEHILLTYGGVIHMDEENEPYLSSTKMGLYFASDWQNPQELSAGAYFTWYLTMVWKENLPFEELQEKYKSPFGPETGWFFPQDFYEPLIQQYFDVPTEYLRSDTSIYDEEHQGYYIGTGGGIGEIPAIVLQDIESDGDLRKLHILLDYGDKEWAPNENKILTVRLMGQGGFRFESYVSANFS